MIEKQTTVIYLNSNSSNEPNIMACGVEHELRIESTEGAFDALQCFLDQHQKWVFGYLSYDLKNEVEDLSSNNTDRLRFPVLFFFVPKAVYTHSEDDFKLVEAYDKQFANEFCPELVLTPEKNTLHQSLTFNSRTSKNDYLAILKKIKSHIQRGDIYETNYCVEFFLENIDLAPVSTYLAANEFTLAPYSAFFKHKDLVAISGSPELYLEKEGGRLISKPIKGTRKRGESPEEDEKLKQELKADQKERSENVMIVDLVRNDLSKIAKKGTVQVDELYGIYTFETVHQMISTISCDMADDLNFSDILKASFPMGSMTGAPKVSAMKLMETYEDMKRGLYSGAIGYISPSGDFVFNVVIRTLLYNLAEKYLSLMAGGAITINSEPENEYRECLLKAAALKKAVHELS